LAFRDQRSEVRLAVERPPLINYKVRAGAVSHHTESWKGKVRVRRCVM
jgi:hypothetical protein